MTKTAARLLLASCAALLAQAAQGQTFEVASVKPGDANSRSSSISYRNDTFAATNVTLNTCIAFAYNIQGFQLTGSPGWTAVQRYDIVAKLQDGAGNATGEPEHTERMRTAVQRLLEERFQLAIHRETKTSPAYVLLVGKNGFKPAAPTGVGQAEKTNSSAPSVAAGAASAIPSASQGPRTSGGRRFAAEKMSMEGFARYLSGSLNSPVVDQTGIKGDFDLKLEWWPDETVAGDATSGPSIFAALQEQLGLKLDTQKAEVETIVIDRIEKATAN